MPVWWFGAIAGLLGLLGLLAFLQFRWIDAVSSAERERMQAHLRAAGNRFVQEFDRELMRACLTFAIAPFEWNQDGWMGVGERYRAWSQTAAYPGLLRNAYVASGRGDGGLRLYRFDPQTDRIDSAEWLLRLSPLRRRLEALLPEDSPEFRAAPRPVRWLIEEEVPALVLVISHASPGGPGTQEASPSPGGGSRRVPGALILELDLQFIQQTLLPQLAHKHLSAPGGLDYLVAVVTRSEPRRTIYLSPGASDSSFSTPDLSVALLGLQAEDANALAPAIGFEPRETSSGRFPGWRGPRAGPPHRGRGFALQSVLPGVEGRWQLLVTHRSGSLESAVAGLRSRNLAIAFAILLMLAASVGLIVVLTRRAQRLARLQAEFLAGISHELLTPLAVVRSAAENLADGVAETGEQAQRYGEMIHRQSRRLSEMVQDALGFAVAQSRPRSRFQPVAVAEAIRRAVETCRPAILEAGVELVEEIEPDLPPVRGDATALSHGVRNLLMNGLQYGGDGGWLAVRARHAAGRRGHEVEIAVEDRGRGIETGDLPHIFEPFYRGRTAAASRLHGTGLGLSLVKRIAEEHGGRVSVTSRRPTGTVFTLRLPAASPGVREERGG
jgi:signal transduction histidine kinase